MARSISENHLDAYKSGFLKRLFDGIKEDPELSFEIRLNDTVIVYYRKSKILETTINRRGISKVTMLNPNFYKDTTKPSVDLSNPENLKSLTLIRKYFREAKKLIYKYKMGKEFEVQQHIALGNQSFDGKYLVVDMEWGFSQAELPSIERIPKTRIDLVIVDTKSNSDFNDIYLAELKVGTDATDGESGIIDHVEKTHKIIEKEEACNSIINDVQAIIAQKKRLGLITGEPKNFRFAKKPKMMLILGYRSEDEKKTLYDDVEKAKAKAKDLGMEPPVCMMYNMLIRLDDLENV